MCSFILIKQKSTGLKIRKASKCKILICALKYNIIFYRQKEDESDKALSQGVEEDTKGDEEKDTNSDVEKDTQHMEGQNVMQKFKSQTNAGGTDEDNASKRSHEENLHNSDIGEDQNLGADPDY